MADDRNSQTVYGQLSAEIDRLSKRNESLYPKLDTLNAELVQIPFRKQDKIRQKKNQINAVESEIKANERRIGQLTDDQKRLQIVDERNETKQTAYANGIDPNAAWANATASGLGSVASVVGSLSGAGVFSGMGGNKKPSGETPPPPPSEKTPSKTPMYLGIGAAVLVLLMMMKKK